jgi:hypothetical protein
MKSAEFGRQKDYTKRINNGCVIAPSVRYRRGFLFGRFEMQVIRYAVGDWIVYNHPNGRNYVGSVRKLSIDDNGVTVYVEFHPDERWMRLSQDDECMREISIKA